MSATAVSPQSGAAQDLAAGLRNPAVLGTPHGRWQAPAEEAADVNLLAGIARVTGAGKDAPVLVFVDGPSCSMACWLSNHPDGDPAQALGEWCEAARLILRRAHSHPASCMLVDVAEAVRQPVALGELVGNRFGTAAGCRVGVPTLAELDPVALALAAGLVRESRAAQALYAQLQASCMPLTAHEPDSLPPEPVDHDAAVQAWQALMREPQQVKAHAAAETAELRQALERQLCQVCEELNASRAETTEALLQLHGTQEELEDLLLASQQPHPLEATAKLLTAEIETLREDVRGKASALAEQANALVLVQEMAGSLRQQLELELQLQPVREQLQQEQDRLQQAQEQLQQERDRLQQAQEQLQQEQDRLQQAQVQLEQERDRQRQSLDILHLEQDQVRQERTRLQATLTNERQASSALIARHEVALADARQEIDLLQIQLHTLQEELAHHYLSLKSLDATVPTTRASNASLRVGEFVVVGASHVAPHHHLQLDLHQFRTPQYLLPRLTVRLAEHHGRPGLVFLASTEGAPPLAVWQATGQEDGRELLTLVPSDAASKRLLDRMASADWRLLTELVALIHHRLGDASLHAEAPRWRGVADRLQRQLTQLPPRLRYSTIDLSQETTDGEPATLAVRFGDVVFGRDECPDLSLLWRPGTSHGGTPARAPLRLVFTSTASQVPLAGWPHDAEGRPAAELVLPVGPGLSAGEKRQRWSALAPADRDLILALLDALPACAERADAARSSGLGRQALEAAARALFADAMRSQRQARWRRVVRALMRRARAA